MRAKTELALLQNRFIGCSATHGPIYANLLMPMPQARLLSVLEQVLLQKVDRQRVYNQSKAGYNHS